MTEYKELQGVKRICGDYAAWHEIGVYCEYIFGIPSTLGDIGESICEEMEIDWDNLDSVDPVELDKAVRKIVQEHDSDYCDIEIDTILCKFTDGKLVQTYLSI